LSSTSHLSSWERCECASANWRRDWRVAVSLVLRVARTYASAAFS